MRYHLERPPPRVELAAADSTGLEARQASPYFVRRRAKAQKPSEDPAQVTPAHRQAAVGQVPRLMRRYRDFRYGRRWQAEAVMSMIKRRLGPAVAGRSDASRARDTMLKVITHNIMLSVRGLLEVFYRASLTPFPQSDPPAPGAPRPGPRRRPAGPLRD